jgi:adenosylmethionine-8-amino-7-oxononanoate aminotransferase
MADTRRLRELDKAHVWHPFTPMRQWRGEDPVPPLVIERAEGEHLIDTDGRRYIDGVSSLWCNVHGHRVPEIDRAIRDQLDKVAHSTLLGLASERSVELAAELVRIAPRGDHPSNPGPLNKVFYSDSGASAVEVSLKMAVGYWHHRGRPGKTKFVAFRGAYHGDTTGAMAVGFSETFHHPYSSMVFPVMWSPVPDAVRGGGVPLDRGEPRRDAAAWPSEDATRTSTLDEACARELERLLGEHGHEIAAVILEPMMQGAAGMMCHSAGFVGAVRRLTREHGVLMIADEVATGFGRTGKMFACEHAGVMPDVLCVAKGITGGYLPLAATLATDEVEDAFTGEHAEGRTFFHGHTYTGNALGCAAALASLRLFESNHLLGRINRSAAIIAERLNALRDAAEFPHVIDLRQRGLMIGVELAKDRKTREPFDPARRVGAAICAAMRSKGLIVRPLGDVIVLMPIPAMGEASLQRMLDIVVETLAEWREKA